MLTCSDAATSITITRFRCRPRQKAAARESVSMRSIRTINRPICAAPRPISNALFGVAPAMIATERAPE